MKSKRQSGSTFFVVLIIMVALTTLVGAAYEYTSTLQRNMQRTIALQNAQAIGDAALEVAYTQWKETYIPNQTLQLSSSSFSGISKLENSAVSGTVFNNVVSNYLGASTTTWNSTGVTICNYGVVSAGANFQALDTTTTGTSKPVQTYDVPIQTGSGVTGSSFYYLASADVNVPVLSGTMTVKVRRVFRKKFENPFQAAIYFNDPLEINPGESLTVTGKVFSNSNIWAAQGVNTIFNESVTSAGAGRGYYNNYLDYRGLLGNGTNDPRFDSRNGVNTPTVPTFNGGVPVQANPQPLYNVLATSDTLNGNLNNIYHDLIDPPPGALGMSTASGTYTSTNPDPFDNSTAHALDPTSPENFRFYNQADVVVYVNSSGNLQVINQATNSGTASPLTGGTYNVVYTTSTGTVATTNLSGSSQISGTSAYLDTALVYTALMGGTISITTSGSTTGTTTFMSGTGAALSNTGTGGVLTTGSFDDGRQGTWVDYSQVNVAALTTNLNTIAPLISNTANIVYFRDARNDANVATYDTTGGITSSTLGSRLYAWKLANGANLALPALTIASQNPVYIQGNFNTGGIPNSSNTATSVTGTNYYVVTSSPTGNYGTQSGPPPTAVVADAITILSGSFNDANSNQTLTGGKRNPSGDTVDAALLSGQVPTNTENSTATYNYYSGGVENYPRFLENWSNSVPFAYVGSIVELFKSKQAFKEWETTNNYYNAPYRNWSFDMHFLATPPAGFNYTIVFSRYQWFTQ